MKERLNLDSLQLDKCFYPNLRSSFQIKDAVKFSLGAQSLHWPESVFHHSPSHSLDQMTILGTSVALPTTHSIAPNAWIASLQGHRIPTVRDLEKEARGRKVVSQTIFFFFCLIEIFFFQLQLTFNIILYCFQMHAIVVRQS